MAELWNRLNVKIACPSFKNIIINTIAELFLLFGSYFDQSSYFRINIVSFECRKKLKLIKIPSIDSYTTDESKEENQVLNIKYLRHCREIKIGFFFQGSSQSDYAFLFYSKVFQFSKDRILRKMMRINNNKKFTRIQRKIRKLLKKKKKGRNGTRSGQK